MTLLSLATNGPIMDEDHGPTRTHEFLRTCRSLGDPAVDVAAILGIGILASQADPSVATELASMMAAVAGAKRFLGRKK